MLHVVSILGAVYLFGVVSVFFAPDGAKSAVWWPAAGLSVLLLLLAPKRWHPALALGVAVSSGLANFTAGRPELASLGFGVSNGLEAYLVAFWLTRRSERATLQTLDDFFRLAVATLLGAVTVGLGAGLTVFYILDGPFIATDFAVMASHGAAVLLIAPLAMRVPESTVPRVRNEALLQWTLLIGAVGYVFSPFQFMALAFLPMPLLVWAALRLGVRTVTRQLLVTGVMTGFMTVQGWGPFAVNESGRLDPGATAFLVQAFLLVSAVVALPLAVAIAQRATVLERLSANEELFRKSFSESFVGMLLLRRGEDGLQIAELNETAADILGGTVDDLEGAAFAPMLATKSSLDELVRQMLAGEIDGWREELWLARSEPRRVGVSLSPLSDQGPDPVFTAQIIDMTATHDAAERLRTEKDFTSAVLNTANCIIAVVDMDGMVVGINPTAQRVTGYAEDEVVGKSLWEALIPEADRASVEEMFSGYPGSRIPLSYEGDLVTSAGDRRRVVWSNAFLSEDNGPRTHVVMTGIDVTAERAARNLVNHVLEAATGTVMIGTDLDGTITVFNAGARRLLGHSAEEVLNRVTPTALIDPAELAARASELGMEPGFEVLVAGANGNPETRDWTCVHKDGRRFTLSLTITPVLDTFGRKIGYLGVGEDVTEQRRGQQVLVATIEKERQVVARLRELDQAKSDFVSSVSHELRTPITSIVGYTEMLKDGLAGEVSAEQDRLLDAVRRNGERLIALIEDLLTLSSIEAGSFTLEKEPVDLRSVVNRAREALQPLLARRRLDVSFVIPDHAVTVTGDAGQLERVVLNLMSNAVKFTEDGGAVSCVLRNGGSQAFVEVEDTGIGIPAQEQGELFNRFFRSTTAQERAIQGTGLGLSIVQSIVQSHGGEIKVASEHLAGTVFSVALPVTDRVPELSSY